MTEQFTGVSGVTSGFCGERQGGRQEALRCWKWQAWVGGSCKERWANGVFHIVTLSWKKSDELPSLPGPGAERSPVTRQGLDPTLQGVPSTHSSDPRVGDSGLVFLDPISQGQDLAPSGPANGHKYAGGGAGVGGGAESPSSEPPQAHSPHRCNYTLRSRINGCQCLIHS